MSSLIKKIWIVTITLILLYSFTIPFTSMRAYKIIYPISATYIFLFVKNWQYKGIASYSLISTLKSMTVIVVWGVLLALFYGTLQTSKDPIMFFGCFISVVIVFCFNFQSINYRKICEATFFLFSFAVAVSGIYEAVTGNFYHITHVSYLYGKNMFGLSRPNTIFVNINDSAVFMCMSFVVSLLFTSDLKRKNVIRFCSLLVFGLNILFTESRGALLGLAIIIYICFVSSARQNKKSIYFILLIPVVLIFVYWLVSIIDFSDLNELGGRSVVWEKSLRNLKNSFFLGTGPGNTYLLNGVIQGYGNSVSAVHNFFLEVACDYGFIGFLAILTWFIRIIKTSRKQMKNSKRASIIFAGLVAFIPLSVSSSSLIGKAWVLCYLGILIAELSVIEIDYSVRRVER